jgi:hypothetical protein
MDDNLYPNDGAYFKPISEPAEQTQERSQEEAEVANASPLIQGLIEHLDTRIAFRDSIKAVNVNIEENPLLHQKTCAVNDMLADALREEKRLLEEYIKTYEK